MEKSDNTGRVIGALLIGTAIGGILGVLMAPAKGSDTRKRIMAKGDDLSNAIKGQIDGIIEEAKREIAVVKEKAAELLDHQVERS